MEVMSLNTAQKPGPGDAAVCRFAIPPPTSAPLRGKDLRVLSESTDCICAERLQPNLVWIAKHLAQHGELAISEALLAQLSQISVSTVKRILRRIRQDQPRLPRRKPSQGNALRRNTPIRRIVWNENQPGYFEQETVDKQTGKDTLRR